MTPKLTLAFASSLALMTAAPLANAAVISINDFAKNETLSVQVRAPFQRTSPGDFLPGTGSFVDFTSQASLDANNMISGSIVGERGSTSPFATRSTGDRTYIYIGVLRNPRVKGFTGISDVFVIQEFGGTTPDIVTFISHNRQPR